ncbi:serine/threonine protein kinase [Myxococcus sp. K38C18041901]|uniref:serine/threonine-protein kinase n=1 Tax=Myxococcus guangdongensis TaxID=2906760 RepID=UPI0020A7C441|nr:serine/threonine-protein kinase [Myxococcus guangdongensis]MCP3058776.1 serine/threonine protein kinase [Myxococcus guangdongensis]
MGNDDLFAQTLLSSRGGPVSGEQRVGVELREGSLLGSYQLESLLGEGSMGRVFQARHARLGRQVALKVLKPEHARDGGFVQRFFQEARTVNQINHEHIVEIFDFVDEGEGGHVYCVMELLRGQGLGALLKQEPLSLARIQRIAVQVCAALGAAHQVGVVHRDIKPDNLFLTQRAGQPDFVKVLDFGVAKHLATEGAVPTGTLDGTIIGTPAYMSPEQAAGLTVDARSDIYAVGNILYEMLTGRPPFQAEAFGQLVVQIITQPPPPLPTQMATGEPLPSQLAELVMRCLAKEPEARPQTLAEVTTGLLLLPVQVSSSPEAVAALEPSERPTRRMPTVMGGPHRRRALWAAGVGTLALLAAGALVWRGATAPSAPVIVPSAAESVVSPERAPEPVVLAPTPEEVVVPAVKLTVHSFPEGAQVVRSDTGEVLGITPLVRELPRREVPLHLRVELAGYVSSVRSVRLDSHTELEVPLAKSLTAPRANASKKSNAKKPPQGTASSRKSHTRAASAEPSGR